MTDNKVFWERWAKRYDSFMEGSHRIYGKAVCRMKHSLNLNMTVLELACGTGLLSVQLAGSVKLLEATDFSAEMIKQAKLKPRSSHLNFSVQDATNLPYSDESFDAVIISNALHIMPRPEAAVSEIKRVLKSGGLLIAPTFTAADSFLGRMKIRIMELSGFKVFNKWTPDEYLKFLRENGFNVISSDIYGGVLKLTYAEAKIMQ